jgi:hypothetical protein
MRWKLWPKWETYTIVELLSCKAFQGHYKALDSADVKLHRGMTLPNAILAQDMNVVMKMLIKWITSNLHGGVGGVNLTSRIYT